MSVVKRTLVHKDQQLVQTKQDLREHQDVMEVLEQERSSTAPNMAADGGAPAGGTSHDDSESEEGEDGQGVDAMDPALLRLQQEEIARLMDLLDEEAERRRQVETELHISRARGGTTSATGSESDDDSDRGSPDSMVASSLESEMVGLSLAAHVTTTSTANPIGVDPAELERLEKEKSEVQAELEGERARFAAEQAAMRAEQERMHTDSAVRAVAEKAAQQAQEAMEQRLAEEKVSLQRGARNA